MLESNKYCPTNPNLFRIVRNNTILNENAKNVEYPLTNEQHLKYER